MQHKHLSYLEKMTDEEYKNCEFLLRKATFFDFTKASNTPNKIQLAKMGKEIFERWDELALLTPVCLSTASFQAFQKASRLLRVLSYQLERLPDDRKNASRAFNDCYKQLKKCYQHYDVFLPLLKSYVEDVVIHYLELKNVQNAQLEEAKVRARETPAEKELRELKEEKAKRGKSVYDKINEDNVALAIKSHHEFNLTNSKAYKLLFTQLRPIYYHLLPTKELEVKISSPQDSLTPTKLEEKKDFHPQKPSAPSSLYDQPAIDDAAQPAPTAPPAPCQSDAALDGKPVVPNERVADKKNSAGMIFHALGGGAAPIAHSIPEDKKSHESDKSHPYSKHMQGYIITFNDKIPLSKRIEEVIQLVPEAKKRFAEFIDPITKNYMDIPVSLNEKNYDLDALRTWHAQGKGDLLTQEPFTLPQIQSAPLLYNKADELIKEVMKEYQEKQQAAKKPDEAVDEIVSIAPGGPGFYRSVG